VLVPGVPVFGGHAPHADAEGRVENVAAHDGDEVGSVVVAHVAHEDEVRVGAGGHEREQAARAGRQRALEAARVLQMRTVRLLHRLQNTRTLRSSETGPLGVNRDALTFQLSATITKHIMQTQPCIFHLHPCTAFS
jgi:hypothetical protein